jgi:hypothetical protein
MDLITNALQGLNPTGIAIEITLSSKKTFSGVIYALYKHCVLVQENTSTLPHIHIINLNSISHVSIINSTPSKTIIPSFCNILKIQEREQAAIKLEREKILKIGINVTKEAQVTFCI